MNYSLIFIIVAAVIVSALLVVLILYLINKNKYEKFVLKNSNCIKRIHEINKSYDFYPYVCYDQSHTYDNKDFYNTVSCKDYLIYQLQFIQKAVTSQIHKVKSNERLYRQYIAEINSVLQFGNYQAPVGKLNKDKLIKKEKIAVKKQVISAPVTQFVITVSLYRSDLYGHVYDGKSQSFSADEILSLIKKLNIKNGNFICDNETWEAICRVERGKVSNKMRISIYNRDGHRCRYCGVSERYAKLEIDHIVPIAKGGKSTYDNLQTLCHDCNVKKGDRI